MSPQYLSPGVYVEEVDKGSKPIEGVATSIAGFIGFAEKGPVNYPTFVANWNQFAQTFGEFLPGGYLAHAVYGYFNNGGGSCYVTRLPGGNGSGEAEATKSQASLPSSAQASIETLSVTALEEGEASVEVSKPSGEDVPEDQFNLKIKVGTKEETFENLTFKKGKAVRNVIDVINKESKLVKVAEKESTLNIAEKIPAPGTYPLAAPPATTTAIAPESISPDAIVGDSAE